MEQRNLLLAIVLSVGILIGFQFLFEKLHPTPLAPTVPTQTAPAAPAPSVAAPGVATPGTAAGGGAPAAPAALTREAAIAEQPRVRINTSRLHGSIAQIGRASCRERV